jgi:hypothetical protein
MASKREMVRYNKQKILHAFVVQLRRERRVYGPHAAVACDQLIDEFTRRADLAPEGPPPGHKALPGLEVTDDNAI